MVWCNAYTEKFMGGEHCVYRVGSATGVVIKDAREENGDQVDAAFPAMDKKGFRLPTEAEWEFAARYEKGESDNSDGTAVPYSNGLWLTKLTYASGATKDYTNEVETGEVAWGRWNCAVNGVWTTHEVGTTSVSENSLGLSDMSGNVYEWCFDRWDGDPTSNDLAYTVEGVVVDPLGALGSSDRVCRGGSWLVNWSRSSLKVS